MHYIGGDDRNSEGRCCVAVVIVLSSATVCFNKHMFKFLRSMLTLYFVDRRHFFVCTFVCKVWSMFLFVQVNMWMSVIIPDRIAFVSSSLSPHCHRRHQNLVACLLGYVCVVVVVVADAAAVVAIRAVALDRHPYQSAA
jgi:hypothetical protein